MCLLPVVIFFSYDPHIIHVCATLNTLAHRPIVQFEIQLPFFVVIRTRSRASGTRDGGRGWATILCERTVILCKEDRGLHAVYHAAYITIVVEYSYDTMEGTTNIKMWAF